MDVAVLPSGLDRMAAVTPERYKAAFRLHPGGVALITATTPTGPVALTASSVASVSAEPAIVMFSVSAASSASVPLRQADAVVVHLLGADNLDLALLGAQHGADRFADHERWGSLTTGEPVFHGARAWLRARVLHRIDAGGSTVVVAEVTHTDVGDEHLTENADKEALVYFDRSWHRIGAATRLG